MNFHLRRNLLLALIIIFIGIIWIFVAVFSNTTSNNTAEISKVGNHIEKIDNFVLQVFNNRQQLTHFVEAEYYFNFKQKPALLINPIIINYNEEGEQAYTMSAKRANYLDNGDIKFKGEVDIKSNTGSIYKVHTEELTVNIDTSDLFSDKAITYLDQTVKVFAQGMHMMAKQDKLYLLGETRINQADRHKIFTRDLMIEQSNNNKIYSTKEKVHYQSDVAEIYAMGMYFDVQAQKITLTGGVTGRYE